jgi:ribulose-phosphate 3-epimerase
VFVDAGASRIAVHVETLPHLHRTIQTIKKLGMSAGAALNPATPVATLEAIAPDLDYVLVMSVNPGFGGQTFIPRSESKVRGVRDLLVRAAGRADIGVDGGIDTTNAGRVAWAGATMLVVGSALFKQADLARGIRELRAAADATVSQ